MEKIIQYLLERRAYYSTMDRDYTFNYIEDIDILIKILEAYEKKTAESKIVAPKK